LVFEVSSFVKYPRLKSGVPGAGPSMAAVVI
jgi:hypothetical protein